MERPFNEDQVSTVWVSICVYGLIGTWSSIIGRSLIAPYRFKNCDNLQIPYISYQVCREDGLKVTLEESRDADIYYVYGLADFSCSRVSTATAGIS